MRKLTTARTASLPAGLPSSNTTARAAARPIHSGPHPDARPLSATNASILLLHAPSWLNTYSARECFATLGADKGSWDKVRVMVALEVHVKQLFLTEGFIAVATGIRLFSSVRSLVHDHVPLLQGEPRRQEGR